MNQKSITSMILLLIAMALAVFQYNEFKWILSCAISVMALGGFLLALQARRSDSRDSLALTLVILHALIGLGYACFMVVLLLLWNAHFRLF